MKIGILYICTGKYEIFWKEFFESSEKYLLPGIEKHYFAFTDADILCHEDECDRIHRIPQENLGWPGNTLRRYEMFLRLKDDLVNFDYLFFFNGNMQFMDYISEDEIIPKEGQNLVACLHPGYFNKKRKKFTYETNSNSKAYIPSDMGEYYFAGGINGGKGVEFIQAMETLNQSIQDDFEKGIIARWHDESHWNRYLLGRKDILVLGPEFLYPEGWKLPFEPKAIVRDKARYGGHFQMRGAQQTTWERVQSLIKKLYRIRGPFI